MAVTFPHYDEATDELVEHTYYVADEVAALLHLHPNTVRERVREGVWDAIRIGRTIYMDARMIGDAMETLRVRAGEIDPAPVTLGIPVADRDMEPIQ